MENKIILLREIEESPIKLGTIPHKKLNDTEKAFIEHMKAEMSWNGAYLWKNVNDVHFGYSCFPGSSVIRDLKEAAKKFGVNISVEKLDNDYYELTPVEKAPKKTKKTPDDYTEAIHKMDKWMPDFDAEISAELESAIGNVDDLASFFENNANTDRLADFVNIGEGGVDCKELARQYMKSQKINC